jgi:hypothetical protein
MENMIRLIGYGWCKAIPARDLKPGMFTIWNYGYKAEVVNIEFSKTGKTIIATIIENGKTYERKMKSDRLVAVTKESLMMLNEQETTIQEEMTTEEKTQPKQTEITATYDENGFITLSNEDSQELTKRFVNNAATKQEQELLKKYHLELQERCMNYKKSLPNNIELFINDDDMYSVVCTYDENYNVGIFKRDIPGKELKHELWRETGILEIITPIEYKEQIKESKQPEQTKVIPSNVEVSYRLNPDLNGIEVYFTSKPDQETIDQLKANGFKWSRNGFWYAKQNESRLKFIDQLTNSNIEAYEPVSYPDINIDDIESYVIDERLQRAEHEANWIFRRNKIDHTKEIQELFLEYTNKVKSIIGETNNERIIYNLKRELQYFKRQYFKNYVVKLQHKASNPSWVITGRGNLNKRKYDKAVNRYDRLMQEGIEIVKRMDNAINKALRQIKRNKTA